MKLKSHWPLGDLNVRSGYHGLTCSGRHKISLHINLNEIVDEVILKLISGLAFSQNHHLPDFKN